jgi:hypothetical protein
MALKPSQKLINRIKKELGLDLPEDTEIRRTRAGSWQKSGGALSWFLYAKSDAQISNYGSTETVGELLKAKELEISGYSTGLFEINAK